MSPLYKHTLIIFFSIILFHIDNNANNLATQGNNTLNFTDNNGLKQGLWEFYYKNSELKEKGNYKNDLKDGVWTSYFESGGKESEITYTKGEAKGSATFYYRNGKIREMGNWQIDHWEGNYQYFHENGQLSYNWNYNKEGKREGKQLYFHDNGKKLYSGNWSDGKTEGKLLVFNKEGNLIEEKIYANGKFSETTLAKPTVSVQNDDSLNSHQSSDDTPRLKFKGTGNHTIIGTNGKITAKGFFVKGLLFNGEKFNYNETNQLISITYFKNGKKEETKVRNR